MVSSSHFIFVICYTFKVRFWEEAAAHTMAFLACMTCIRLTNTSQRNDLVGQRRKLSAAINKLSELQNIDQRLCDACCGDELSSRGSPLCCSLWRRNRRDYDEEMRLEHFLYWLFGCTPHPLKGYESEGKEWVQKNL